jgi:Ca2+:H+ antiporter
VLTYVAGLFFSLRTHNELFNPEHRRRITSASRGRSRRSVIMIAIAGVAVGVMSEILVGSISEASESIGLSPFLSA